MKLRSDFVTNSSSSNFVLQVKDDKLNEKQKEAIANYVRKMILCVETMDEKEISDFVRYGCASDGAERVRKSLEGGGELRQGWVSFEEAEYTLAEIYIDLLGIIEENSDGNVVVLKGNLGY